MPEPVIDIEVKLLYIVRGYLQFKGVLWGSWRPTMREALSEWARRFLREDLHEGDIMQLRLFNNMPTADTVVDVLRQPYMRIALIEDGLGLEDPRDQPHYEYLSVKKGRDAATLERDGWVRISSDPVWPELMDRYSREKR